MVAQCCWRTVEIGAAGFRMDSLERMGYDLYLADAVGGFFDPGFGLELGFEFDSFLGAFQQAVQLGVTAFVQKALDRRAKCRPSPII